jgi:hypothetical protein
MGYLEGQDYSRGMSPAIVMKYLIPDLHPDQHPFLGGDQLWSSSQAALCMCVWLGQKPPAHICIAGPAACVALNQTSDDLARDIAG